MDGALMEIGPYRVLQGGKLEENPGSWDEFANVLFVDNPVGTGFSYVDSDSYVHELDTMADQFITFMDKWLTIFPEYEHDDVSLDIFVITWLLADILLALPGWRVLCWSTYPLYRRTNADSKYR